VSSADDGDVSYRKRVHACSIACTCYVRMRSATGVLGRTKDPSSKVLSDDADVGVVENVRKKRGVAWVEITDRPPNTEVPPGERVAFLRVVKYIRSIHRRARLGAAAG
jgi:hypothetical protein